MKHAPIQAIYILTLCFLFCWLTGCQQDPTIVEIVYVQEEASNVLRTPSQSQAFQESNAAGPYSANLAPALSPETASSGDAQKTVEPPMETVNPLIQAQLPTPSLFPFLTPSPLPTPAFLPTPTPAQAKTPAPTSPPLASPPINTLAPSPTLSQGSELERELLTAAYEEQVRSIQRTYADKINSLQGMLSSLEASLATNPEYAAEIQQEIQATQGQLQALETQQAQELQTAQAEYQASLAALR